MSSSSALRSTAPSSTSLSAKDFKINQILTSVGARRTNGVQAATSLSTAAGEPLSLFPDNTFLPLLQTLSFFLPTHSLFSHHFFSTIIFTFSDHLFSWHFCTITQFSLISVFLSLCLLFSLFREHQKLHWKKHKSSCCAYKVSLVKVFVTKAVLCIVSTRFAVHQTSAATWWPPET